MNLNSIRMSIRSMILGNCRKAYRHGHITLFLKDSGVLKNSTKDSNVKYLRIDESK